jgi:hypothetical protein
MHNKAPDIAYLGSHLSYGAVCNGNDIKVGILGDGLRAVTPSDTAHLMS